VLDIINGYIYLWVIEGDSKNDAASNVEDAFKSSKETSSVSNSINIDDDWGIFHYCIWCYKIR